MPENIHIKLPDGSEKEVPKGATALDVAKSISPRLADAALAASPLGQPIQELLQAADGADSTATLIVQGMVLERLGQIIYKALSAQQTVSDATRALAVAS